MSRPLVIYHGPGCADGFCAAWVANRYFKGNADFVPAQYGQEPPDATDRDLYILDFSYKHDVMRRLIRQAAEIVVCDHHKTAQAEFEGLDRAAMAQGIPHRFVFDMNKSGARLAWDYFFPDEPRPFLIDLVEDRDLWRWRLPSSRELSAWLASLPHDFDTWDQVANDLTAPWKSESYVGKLHGEPPDVYWHYDRMPEGAIEQGAAILRYQSQQVEAICSHASEVDIGGHRVLAANTPVLQSEVAGKLAEGRPFGATFFIRPDGKRVWSLRSREGGIDVSLVAKAHGGGGHRNAAGFEA